MNRMLIVTALIAGVMAADADQKLVMDGSTTVGPIAKAFAEYYMRENPGVNITVSESGSGNGAKALLNGSCDIANLSRDLKDSEKSAMKEMGVDPCKHIVAFDALPVIVHPSNRVKRLTIDQVRDIYTGKITNWKDVGGGNRRIVVISRDTNSGTFETFMHLVMGKDARITDSAEYTGSNGAVRQRVQMTRGAIGYAGLGFVDRSVKPLAINGIEPSAETVLNKTYPLARELYMFTNGKPVKDSLVQRFLALMKTVKGEEIIEEIGFVPLDAK
ncbi:MAG: phosphate ABC transporter substrate-binding protein [Bacteroidales bacterium]|nr:phosphate ABC transporter substrate-binding protein [Bacteroidales bacterium]